MEEEANREGGIQSTSEKAAEERMKGLCGSGGGVCWALAAGMSLCLAMPGRAQGNAAQTRRFVVVVDAAHGGADAGAALAANGAAAAALEKDVTLEMSRELRALLVARGFTVVETREGDQAMDGDERATVANRAAAEACVVLHATEAGSGVHLFVSSLAPAQVGLLMPWKTAQAGWVAESLKLSGVLDETLSAAGKEDGAAIPVTMGRTTLPGVDSMACPAVAVEVGPLRDGTRSVVSDVGDGEYRTRVMQAVAAALLAWRSEAGEP